MKRIALITLLLASVIFINAKINWKDCEKEKGSIVKQEIKIDRFDKIQLLGSHKVYLTTGKAQKVTIETTQNIIDLLKKDVENGTWKISFEKCINTKNEIVFYVDVDQIQELAVIGSGDIIGKNKIETEELTLNVKGSGDIKLNVGVSKLHAKIQGSGDIELTGETSFQSILVQGSGDYEANHLTSQEAEAIVNGSGDIEINVTQKITANVNGSGDILYSGNPSEVEKKVNGSGDIKAQ